MIQMCNWLGFYDLADMLGGVRGPDVYVLAVSENVPTGPGNAGYAVASLIVSAYDRHADGQIRYWSLRLGTLATVGGQPLNADQHRKLARTSRGAEESMCEHLQSIGFHPVRAAIARPVGFQYLDSDMSTVGYDEDTNKFTFGAGRPGPPRRLGISSFDDYQSRGGTMPIGQWTLYVHRYNKLSDGLHRDPSEGHRTAIIAELTHIAQALKMDTPPQESPETPPEAPPQTS